MNSNYPQDDTLSLLKTGKLQGSTRLKLQCGLTEFPAEIFTLADHTVICPGHGPLTTVGEEKAHNPFYPEYK